MHWVHKPKQGHDCRSKSSPVGKCCKRWSQWRRSFQVCSVFIVIIFFCSDLSVLNSPGEDIWPQRVAWHVFLICSLARYCSTVYLPFFVQEYWVLMIGNNMWDGRWSCKINKDWIINLWFKTNLIPQEIFIHTVKKKTKIPIIFLI